MNPQVMVCVKSGYTLYIIRETIGLAAWLVFFLCPEFIQLWKIPRDIYGQEEDSQPKMPEKTLMTRMHM